MKKLLLTVIAGAALLLSGCEPKMSPSPTPSPTNSVTPAITNVPADVNIPPAVVTNVPPPR